MADPEELYRKLMLPLALMKMAQGVMTPAPFGQSQFGQIAGGISGGAGTYMDMLDQQMKRQRELAQEKRQGSQEARQQESHALEIDLWKEPTTTKEFTGFNEQPTSLPTLGLGLGAGIPPLQTRPLDVKTATIPGGLKREAVETGIAKEKAETAKLLRPEKPEKGKYQIGELVPVKIGSDIVTKQVTGFNPDDSPIFKTFAIAPAKTTLSIENLTRPTQTGLEKDIIEGTQKVMELGEIERLYNPLYLQYKGGALSAIQKQGDKIGIGGITGTKFLANRSAFIAQSKQFSNTYRKFVTGTAAGEKEQAEILKAIPDIESDSPTQFKAKLKQTKYWATKLNNWHKYTRTMGLSISETPEEADKAQKLMPKRLTPSGATGIEDLSGKTVEELVNMLSGAE